MKWEISLVLINALIINIIGLLVMYSTSVTGQSVLVKEVLFMLVSLIAFYVVSRLDYSYFKYKPVFVSIIFTTIVLLGLTLLVGTERNGARRWFSFGGDSGFLLQISEFSKIVAIMSMSLIMCSNFVNGRFNRWLKLIIAAVLCVIFSGLIFLEPDAGMTLVIVIISALIIFWGFDDHKYLLKVALPAIAAFLVALGFSYGVKIMMYIGIAVMLPYVFFLIQMILKKVHIKEFLLVSAIFTILGCSIGFGIKPFWSSNVLKDYQKERILSFINEVSFQIEQAQVAIGSGMFFGKGLGHGTQSKLRFLPEHQTDFAFASFAEEFGFVGSTILLILYLFLIIQILYTGSKIKDKFGSLMVTGIGVKICLEFLINIGMNLGITPATGLPLPFFSYGGSSLLANYIALALVQSVYTIDAQRVM